MIWMWVSSGKSAAMLEGMLPVLPSFWSGKRKRFQPNLETSQLIFQGVCSRFTGAKWLFQQKGATKDWAVFPSITQGTTLSCHDLLPILPGSSVRFFHIPKIAVSSPGDVCFTSLISHLASQISSYLRPQFLSAWNASLTYSGSKQLKKKLLSRNNGDQTPVLCLSKRVVLQQESTLSNLEVFPRWSTSLCYTAAFMLTPKNQLQHIYIDIL